MAALNDIKPKAGKTRKIRKTIKNMKNELNSIYSEVGYGTYPRTNIRGNEIIIGIVSHGQDFPRKTLSDNLRNKTRMCVAGDLDDSYCIQPRNKIDDFYDELLKYEFQNLKFRQRKIVVENVIKIRGYKSDQNEVNKVAFKLNRPSDIIMNQKIKHIKPVHDHLYDFTLVPITNTKKIGSFTVLFSSMEGDGYNTYSGIGNKTGNMLEDPYWLAKGIIRQGEIDTKKIYLSKLLTRLREAQYENIYIIDLSCRDTVNTSITMYERKMQLLSNQEESSGSYSPPNNIHNLYNGNSKEKKASSSQNKEE